MKRLSILLFALSLAALSHAQVYKWLLLTEYVATGTNTYSVNIPGLTLVKDDVFKITFPANTGASTLNINSTGAKNLYKQGSTPLVSGDLGGTSIISYDGTNFQVIGGAGGAGSFTAGNLTTSTTGVSITGGTNAVNGSGTAISIQNATTSQNGLLTNTDWNTFNSKQPAGNYITALTGDITASGPGSAAATLATVNSNVGTFGSATQSLTATVNAKGLITAISAQTVTPAVGSITGLGTGVSTWLATPSWTNFNSAITGTTPYWSLANGGTLTGANTITGSASNTLKTIFNSLGGSVSSVTNGAGLWMANTTAATSGNQQVSPWLIFEGQGWGTTAGTTQSVKYALGLNITQGTTPSGSISILSSVNGGAYSGSVSFGSSSISTSTVNFTSGGSIQGSTSNTYIAPNANTPGHQFNHSFSSNVTNGIGVDWTQGFAPTSGTTTWKGMRFSGTINQTGGANGATTMIDAIHTLTSSVGAHTFLHYKPTETSVGTHYFIANESITTLSGLGTGSPGATLDIRGNGSTNPAVRIASGGTSTEYAFRVQQSDVTTDIFTVQGNGNGFLKGVMQWGTNSTGAGSAALGANSPATTLTAPYTWIQMKSSDGSTVYVPAWK